jgi:hypothetical protein
MENKSRISTLTAEDYRRLEEESGIPPWLADAAGIRRVSSQEAADLVGRERDRFTDKLNGWWIPNRAPFRAGERAGRLRRDVPDVENGPNGTKKEKNKYLCAPGQPNLAYFTPETTQADLDNPDLPVVIVEGEKKALGGKPCFDAQ